MNPIAVSNLAWRRDEDAEIQRVLLEEGVRRIEIAPGKVWPDPTRVHQSDASQWRDAWRDHGFEVVAFQALLFGHPELQLFGSQESRARMLEHLAQLMTLARVVGATRLVFGSPGNRRADGLAAAERECTAVAFFRDVASVAEGEGVALCIEPNPPEYGCDFITTAAEGAALVRAVARPGFRLHLDSAAMHMVGDVPEREIPAAAEVLAHFHASEPQLAEVGSGPVDHARAAAALRDAAYAGCVSIEMREQPDVASAGRVGRVARAVTQRYGAPAPRPAPSRAVAR